VLPARAGTAVRFTVTAKGVDGGRLRIFDNGRQVTPELAQDGNAAHFTLPGDGKRHWVRVDVLGSDGRLLLLGNPVYLNW
jgi:hypothetical protein